MNPTVSPFACIAFVGYPLGTDCVGFHMFSTIKMALQLVPQKHLPASTFEQVMLNLKAVSPPTKLRDPQQQPDFFPHLFLSPF